MGFADWSKLTENTRISSEMYTFASSKRFINVIIVNENYTYIISRNIQSTELLRYMLKRAISFWSTNKTSQTVVVRSTHAILRGAKAKIFYIKIEMLSFNTNFELKYSWYIMNIYLPERKHKFTSTVFMETN